VKSAPDVRVLRLSHGDPHPGGLGFLAEEQPWPVAQVAAVTEQPTAVGSFGVVDACFTGQEGAATLVMWALFTRLDKRTVIASWLTAEGPALVVAEHGRLGLRLPGGKAGRAVLTSPHDVRERVWYFVAAGSAPTTACCWRGARQDVPAGRTW
jgi:hypothetical protein